MHGNIWEWVQDNWHADYNGAPTDGSSWESGSVRVRVKFMIISENSNCISINRASDLLDASRSGYYKWLHNSHSSEVEKDSDIAIKDEMQKIVIEFPGYGYRRIKVIQIAE